MDNNHPQSSTDSNGQAFLNFCLTKKDKLTSALYLVTSFIMDQEPIKWRLRDRALSLFADVGLARDAAELYQIAVLEKVNRTIEEICSLLNIATAGGFITEMNASVLKKEYSALREAIADRQGVRPLENLLSLPVPELSAQPVRSVPEASVPKVVDSKSTVSVPSAPVIPARESNRPTYSPTPSSKITLRQRAGSDDLPLARSPLAQPGRIVNPYHQSSAPTPSATDNSIGQAGQASQNSRQQSLLSYIQGRGWTPISDLAEAVPGVSLKTVQRELATLVEAGRLKKMGERRWSRYCLAP